MAINLNKIFEAKTEYLLLREKKAEIISGNIANADTPGYKAESVEFSSMLKKAQHEQKIEMSTTNERHIASNNIGTHYPIYQAPDQPDTGDGNTVDVMKERNLFLKNSLEYQYGLRNIDGMIKGIKKAINGGSS